MSAISRSFFSSMPELDGKSLLITGGTGSFGQAFVATVLKRFKPRRLIIFSRDELKQFEMQQRFSPSDHESLRYFIGDVRDPARLQIAFRGVDYVIHAAAMKQVPTAEYNPFECINTNVIGAENVVHAAMMAGVRRVIALSTDKAANPINLYGASKLAADKIFVAANNFAGGGAEGVRFAVVRYGNVIGSRGSVVETFQRMLAGRASTLPITDERMTRFWITVQQGVDFVLSSFAIMRGGELFVPKIPSMRVVDLARAMAPNVPHRIIGIRPGEKIHEVLITPDDARLTLELEDRYIVQPSFPFWTDSPHRENTKSLAEGFSFSSDNNPEWLDAPALSRLIAESAAQKPDPRV